MNTTLIMDELVDNHKIKPGTHLAALRKERGYSQDYIAGKLHLRVRIIELLEADDYHHMPEPVFIKGYIRGYAKLLDVPSEPLLAQFNGLYSSSEQKLDKALWQSRRETHRGEHAVRWFTIVLSIGALVAVAVWWYANKDNERLFSANSGQPTQQTTASANPESDIRLTDLSKMRSLLTSPPAFAQKATGSADD